jgi:hypothetical protein
MAHLCHARGCSIPVPPQMLMCKRHWFRVHPKLRRAVWNNYRDGQCEDMTPSDAWHKAADAAIGYVAALEGLEMKIREVNALTELGFSVREKHDKIAVEERS